MLFIDSPHFLPAGPSPFSGAVFVDANGNAGDEKPLSLSLHRNGELLGIVPLRENADIVAIHSVDEILGVSHSVCLFHCL